MYLTIETKYQPKYIVFICLFESV